MVLGASTMEDEAVSLMAERIINILMKKYASDKIENILLRSANWVGDAVMTTPAIRGVRQNFPGAKISILAKPWVAPVFSNNKHVDQILLYDTEGRHNGWTGLLRLARDLKRYHFDAAVLFQNAFEAALLTFLAGIPRRIGYCTDGRSILLTDRVRGHRELKTGHQIDYYLGILNGAGLITENRSLCLKVTEKEKQAALHLLKQYGVLEPKNVIGINPGAAFGTAKRWFPERYAALIKKIHESHKAYFFIFGGAGEASLGNKISDMTGGYCINLCGKTRLREAIALINVCRLFITNDSGLMHVAAALDIPQVAIIGPTDHINTGPANSLSHIVRVPTSCSPCLKPECPEDHRCMKKISVEMVYSVAESILKKGCNQ